MHWFKHSPAVDIIISKYHDFVRISILRGSLVSHSVTCDKKKITSCFIMSMSLTSNLYVCPLMFKNWSHTYICIYYTLTETNIDISFRAVSSHFSTLGYHTNIHACKKGNWHIDELSTSVCCQMGMRDMIQRWWARCGSVTQFRPPSVCAEWRGADDLPNDQGCGFYSPFIHTYIFIFF